MAKPVTLLCGRDRPKRAILGIYTVLLLFCWAPRIGGQPLQPITEESIKAAYLYRFTEYVRWPAGVFESPTAPLVIAVVGDKVLADELRSVTARRSVHGRPLVVRELAEGDFVAGVHILFVAEQRMEDLARFREAARGQSAVLVTESPEALEHGSVINFTPVDRRVRFEVSLDSADKSNIRLSSQLLAVAERVETGAN